MVLPTDLLIPNTSLGWKKPLLIIPEKDLFLNACNALTSVRRKSVARLISTNNLITSVKLRTFWKTSLEKSLFLWLIIITTKQTIMKETGIFQQQNNKAISRLKNVRGRCVIRKRRSFYNQSEKMCAKYWILKKIIISKGNKKWML